MTPFMVVVGSVVLTCSIAVTVLCVFLLIKIWRLK